MFIYLVTYTERPIVLLHPMLYGFPRAAAVRHPVLAGRGHFRLFYTTVATPTHPLAHNQRRLKNLRFPAFDSTT